MVGKLTTSDWSEWCPIDVEEILWFKVNMKTGNVRIKARRKKFIEIYNPRTGKRRRTN